MKKIKIIFCFIISAMVCTTIIFANDLNQLVAEVVQYDILINGEEKEFQLPIVTIDDRTYIPLREAGGIFGMSVDWVEETQTVIMNNENHDEKLYPFERNGLWGYMNQFGEILIEPKYRYAHEFSEGLAKVPEGFIDETGTLVIPLSNCYYAGEFSEGVSAIIERAYTDEEKKSITDVPGPFVFIDKEGKHVFDQEFSYATIFQDGYAEVRLTNGKATYIDRTGNIATDLNFISTGKFVDGYAVVNIENQGLAVIDKEFNVTDLKEYDQASLGEKGYITVEKGDKYGVIDVNKNIIIDFQYEYLSKFSDGCLAFRNDKSEKGYIDINNNVLLTGNFSVLKEFDHGCAIVVSIESKYGVMNKNMEYVVPPEYQQIDRIGENIFSCLTKAGTYQYFDKDGNEIIPH